MAFVLFYLHRKCCKPDLAYVGCQLGPFVWTWDASIFQNY